MPKYSNPADFFLKLLSVNYPKTIEDEKKVTKLLGDYKNLMSPAIEADDALI